MATRTEVIRALRQRYGQAARSEKGRILDEFVKLTKYHRKHAVRVLSRDERSPPHGKKIGRRIYDEAVQQALIVIWEAADRICAKRLRAVLVEFMDTMERHGHLELNSGVREKLVTVSAATIDRMLKPIRATANGRKRRRVSPSSVKSRVPVRTFADWHDPLPGHFETDFVGHSGGSTAGSCVHTLVLTDIASGWTECIALAARERSLLLEALAILETLMPVPLLALDTDNDSAFMNEAVLGYCGGHNIELTRGRPYRKNDQAWVEQKNGSVVRRFTGYHRFTGLLATQTLTRLYRLTRLYVNFFQPSFKLRSKQRVGAKVRKQYLAPATPCDRLLASDDVSDELKQRLRAQRAELDPVRLLHGIRELQTMLASLSTLATDGTGASRSLSEFLTQLPRLWQEGEVRATHRNQGTSPRTWRTRADPFALVWPQLLVWLEKDPDMTAKDLFSKLRRKHPGTYTDGQLRTLQRRVQGWRKVMAMELIGLSGTNSSAGYSAETARQSRLEGSARQPYDRVVR